MVNLMMKELVLLCFPPNSSLPDLDFDSVFVECATMNGKNGGILFVWLKNGKNIWKMGERGNFSLLQDLDAL